METSPAWFTDEDQAVDVLERLGAAGLQVFPWVNASVRDLDRLGADRTSARAEFEAACGPDYLRRIPARCWIHLGGRALDTFRPVMPSRDLPTVLGNSPASCARTLKDTSHLHIDLYGS